MEPRLLSVSDYYARLSECMQKVGLHWDEHEEGDWLKGVADEGAALTAVMGEAEGRSVLDCSCGPGGQAIPLAELGWKVAATDVSEANLNLAWKRAAQRGVHIACYLCDMRHLDTHFREPFDWVITCGGALTEIETDEGIAQALRQMFRVLRPGGKCYIEMRNMDFLVDEDRPRYQFAGEHRTAHGRVIRVEDWEYESDTHVIKTDAFLTEDERCEDFGRWQTEVLSYRRRVLRRLELEHLLQAAGFVQVVFRPRDPWQSHQIVATKPGESTSRPAARSADRTFTIRPYAAGEWRDVWRVRLFALADAGVFLDHTEIAEGPDPDVGNEAGEWDIEFPEKSYLPGAGSLWLAWDGDLPIGNVGGLDLGGGGIELQRMFVRADYRRRGVGSALVRALIEHSRAHGARAVELWTGPDGPGRWLYQAVGFRQTERPGPEFSMENPNPYRHVPAADHVQIRMRLDL